MTTPLVIFIYLTLVLLIGALSHRLFLGTSEDYFLATRTIGPFVLLMSLFGTNMTAFTLLGASSQAYHSGIGVFALMASSSALVIPLVFFLLGPRIWALGKLHGYLTQVQFFRARWESDAFGLLLFFVLIILLIPYLLIGVMAGGVTLNVITNGEIPEWLGGLIICLVVLAYVTYGGLRGTAWANTFQTLVFMILGGLSLYVVVKSLGGLDQAMAQVAHSRPDLLARGDHMKPLHLLSYTLVPVSVGMFPHMFMHWLSARRAETFRYPLMFYPICVAVVWLPSVLLGILGNIDFPGLQGPQANNVLIRMIELHAPPVLAGLLAAGVLAAVMSSLDSQVLSIGTMFTQDIVRHYGFHDRMSEKKQIFIGRIFVVGVLVITYSLFLVSSRSIFGLGIWSFSGFTALFPVVTAALFWKRSTKEGAFASVISVMILWIYLFISSGQSSSYTLGGTGIMPVALLLSVSSAMMIIVSLLTCAPNENVIRKFFNVTRT